MCDADAVNPISLRRGDMSLKGGTVGSQARSQRHAWTCTEDGLEFRDLRELQLHMKRKVRPRRDVHSPRSRDGGEGGFLEGGWVLRRIVPPDTPPRASTNFMGGHTQDDKMPIS